MHQLPVLPLRLKTGRRRPENPTVVDKLCMTGVCARRNLVERAKTVSAGSRFDNISYLLFTFSRFARDLLGVSVAGPVGLQQFFDHDDGYGPARQICASMLRKLSPKRAMKALQTGWHTASKSRSRDSSVMSAEIIQLADFRVRGGVLPGQVPGQAHAFENHAFESQTRFHFWTGATGRRYVHTVYSLFDCPPVGVANYVLARREGKTQRSVLAIGRLSSDAPSLNLAEIRQRAATVGADEVHIHLLATSDLESQAVEVDLRTAQPGVCSN